MEQALPVISQDIDDNINDDDDEEDNKNNIYSKAIGPKL